MHIHKLGKVELLIMGGLFGSLFYFQANNAIANVKNPQMYLGIQLLMQLLSNDI